MVLHLLCTKSNKSYDMTASYFPDKSLQLFHKCKKNMLQILCELQQEKPLRVNFLEEHVNNVLQLYSVREEVILLP